MQMQHIQIHYCPLVTNMLTEQHTKYFIINTSGDLPRFTPRQVLGVYALHATLKVEQRCDRLFQTLSVILVLTALLKLL